MGIATIKLLALVFIFVSGLLGGLACLRVGTGRAGGRFMAVGNAATGGVFLGVGLIHLLGDAQENFSTVLGDIDYPIALMVAGFGFLLALLTEKVLLGGATLAGSVSRSGAYPWALLLLLSVHSLVAGASLGLEQAFAASLVLFLAIVAHKGAAAFALGVSLQSAGLPRGTTVKTITLFSLTTPAGVALGLLFSQALEGQRALYVEAVFDAIAAGTFLYIAVLEVLGESFASSEDRWLKSASTVAAFALMALVALWT